MTLVVVVAHPDDETFGCGSLLLHAATRTRTVVVCATRGEAGEYRSGLKLPSGGLAELREAELRAAAATLGVAEVEVLGFGDSGMTGPSPAGSLCATPLTTLAERIRTSLARHQASIVVTLDGSDGHRDHVFIRDAVLAAVEPDLTLYLHCLPRVLMHEWLRRRARDDTGTAYAGDPEIGTPEDEITTVVDTARHYTTRLTAISRHRSQASPYDGLPEDLRRRFLCVDHLRRVQPRWPGGTLETDLLGLGGPVENSRASQPPPALRAWRTR